MLGLAPLLLALHPAAAKTLPPGAVIDQALALNVSGDGLNSVAGLLPALLPRTSRVDNLAQSVDLWVCEPGIWMTNIQVDVA